MRDYSKLTRSELEFRLQAAEDVCVLFAWSPVQYNDRAAACFEAWLAWEALGGDSSRRLNPHLSDEKIKEMARQRQATREATLNRLAGRADGAP